MVATVVVVVLRCDSGSGLLLDLVLRALKERGGIVRKKKRGGKRRRRSTGCDKKGKMRRRGRGGGW